MYTLYGIPNCDTVKKARLWLEKRGVPYSFHNFKKDGITAQKIEEWGKTLGWVILLNKKGTTWKKVEPVEQSKINTPAKITDFLKENPSAIKRPVLEKEGRALVVGFKEAEYEQLF